MAASPARRRVLLAVAALVAVIGAGAAAFVLWPKPPPAPSADNDTGLTRDKTEEMMREIGYVQ